MRPYRAKVDDGSWPAAFVDAAQGAQDADQSHDPDSDGQQQQAVQHRRPGRSRGRPQLAQSQAARPTGGDRITTSPTSSARQQQPSCSTASVELTDALTYSNDPSPRQQATGTKYRPITGSFRRRSGRKCRPPAKLRVLASSSHAAPARRSSTCSVNFIDNYTCSDSKLSFNSQYKRLSTSSSDYSIDDSSDNMDYSQHCDVRFASTTSRVESQP